MSPSKREGLFIDEKAGVSGNLTREPVLFPLLYGYAVTSGTRASRCAMATLEQSEIMRI